LLRGFILVIFILSSLYAREFWFEDNNMGEVGYIAKDAKEKFYNISSWQRAFRVMDTYMLRTSTIIKRDGFLDKLLLDKILLTLKEHKKHLALDVGGATWLSYNKNRRRLFKNERRIINYISKRGFKIDYILFQSSLSKPLEDKEYSLDKRIEDILTYSKWVKSKYPYIKLGLIDALFAQGKEYKESYIYLLSKLKQNGIIFDNIIIDIPYNIIKQHRHSIDFHKLKEVENFIRDKLNLRVGIIFTSRAKGANPNKRFFLDISSMAKGYIKVGGNPDYVILSSWFLYPSKTIPDTEAYTMSYDFLKLVEIFKEKSIKTRTKSIKAKLLDILRLF